MLTATYTLVALSVEQANVRLSLLSFQKYVRSTLMQQNSITLSQLEYACETLAGLYHACHWRKTEMYLIPALRHATERADHLLDELSRLNQAALAAIRTLQERADILADVRDGQVELVCDSIETFCTSLLQRLEKEEQELFAIARGAIAGETWFSLANQLMMHDKHLDDLKRSGVALGDQASPKSAAAVVAAAAATRGGKPRLALRHRVDDGANDIPGLQVLPLPGMPLQGTFDDALTK